MKIRLFYCLISLLFINVFCLTTNTISVEAALNFKGIDYVGWHRGDYSTYRSTESLSNVADTGANYVGLSIFWFVPDNDLDNIYQDSYCSPSDADVIKAINDIHSLGMNVMLKLHLNVMHAGYSHEPSSWITPSHVDVGTYFAGYNNFVMHYAQLLQNHGLSAELFCIGTELSGMTPYNYDRWHNIINNLRGAYSGPITYCANYWEEITSVCFWNLLDYAGVAAYCELDANQNPTLEQIINGWYNDWKNGINWVNRFQNLYNSTGKPIIFTEIGYRSIDYAAKEPWNYSVDYSYNGELQARCYQAAFEVFKDLGWFKGIFWWSYTTSPGEGGAGNKDYTPHNKPAENTLSAYYSNQPQPPNPPTNLQAGPWDSQVFLTWNPSAGATGYKVYYGTQAGGPYPNPENAGADTYYTVTDLDNGTAYYFVVTAYNNHGESGYSNEASATPGATEAPFVEISTNNSIYRPNDWFSCDLYIDNPGPTVYVDVYVVLDVYGEFWFWPSWTQDDGYESWTIVTGNSTNNILSFCWPYGAGSASGIKFWSCLTNQGTLDIISNISTCEFSFEEYDRSDEGQNKVVLSEEGLAQRNKFIEVLKEACGYRPPIDEIIFHQ